MKLLMFALAMTTPTLTEAKLQEVNSVQFVNSVAQVEGHKASDLGGRYGLQRNVWSQHTRMPYAASRNPVQADYVAERHFWWLFRNLQRQGFAPTPYLMAACWRFGLEGGLTAVQRGPVDYAVRVHNLYHDS